MTKRNTRSPTSMPQTIPACFATILAEFVAVVGIHAKVLWSPSPTSSISAMRINSSRLGMLVIMSNND